MIGTIHERFPCVLNIWRRCVCENDVGSFGVSGSDTRQWKDYLCKRNEIHTNTPRSKVGNHVLIRMIHTDGLITWASSFRQEDRNLDLSRWVWCHVHVVKSFVLRRACCKIVCFETCATANPVSTTVGSLAGDLAPLDRDEARGWCVEIKFEWIRFFCSR